MSLHWDNYSSFLLRFCDLPSIFFRLVTKFAICFCSKFPSGACNVLEARASVIKVLASLFCREISELTFQRYGSTGTR